MMPKVFFACLHKIAYNLGKELSTLPLLFCKVPCQNLQQVVAAWSLLQPRAFAVEDGFAVARGTREASVLLDVGSAAWPR